MTSSDGCTDEQGITNSYELSYVAASGTLITSCVVGGTECSNGVCRNELQNNTFNSRCHPLMSHFTGENVTVSVAARNIVGKSNPAMSRRISEFLSFSCNLEAVQTCIMLFLYFIFIHTSYFNCKSHSIE